MASDEFNFGSLFRAIESLTKELERLGNLLNGRDGLVADMRSCREKLTAVEKEIKAIEQRIQERLKEYIAQEAVKAAGAISNRRYNITTAVAIAGIAIALAVAIFK